MLRGEEGRAQMLPLLQGNCFSIFIPFTHLYSSFSKSFSDFIFLAKIEAFEGSQLDIFYEINADFQQVVELLYVLVKLYCCI